MKIHPDQIEGVQPEQTQRKNKAKVPGQAFGDMLNQEVAKGDTPQATAGIAPPPILNPLIAAEAAAPVQRVGAGATVAGQVENVLDKWDSYAATLAGPQGGLKSAYGALDEIANDVASIKGQPNIDPGLQSIVNELETLAATEQFKFNRGDYN
ncbi:MAG: hypothetical protein OCC46_10835 [Pseudodesulfovibrio sp.]